MSRHNRRFRWLATLQKPPLAKSSLGKVIDTNIELIDKSRAASENKKSFQDHLADLITRWSGSMLFICAHLIWFTVWIGANSGLFGMTSFDPYPFGLLTTIVSLEAIFLSTFVLVSQNRQATLADRRSELDLQINLLTEYEMTRVLTIVDRLAKKFDIEDCDDDELAELEQDVKPDHLLKELEKRERDCKR